MVDLVFFGALCPLIFYAPPTAKRRISGHHSIAFFKQRPTVNLGSLTRISLSVSDP